jgi:hypothetical protein
MGNCRINFPTASYAAMARVTFYRTKAAEMRKRAASADPDVISATLLNVAETYEHVAASVEEIASKEAASRSIQKS